MLHPDVGGNTVANNAVLNGRRRVADALVRNAMSPDLRPSGTNAASSDRQAIVQALLRMKGTEAPRPHDQPIQLAHYEGFMDPDMPPWALDRGFAGPVTPRYRNLDEMIDKTYDDLLNADHLGVLRDHQSTRFGSRNGQADEAMGPLDLFGGVSSILKSGTKAIKSGVGLPKDTAAELAPPPSAFVGRSGFELENRPRWLTRNQEAVIDGRRYTGHALDRMQNRGIVPSVVEDSIRSGRTYPTDNPARRQQFSSSNEITTIMEDDDVVSTRFGKPKIPK